MIEIKNCISGLNGKVELNHQELSSKLADNIEMKEIILSQNKKIDQLNKENMELRSSNKQLEKDILQLQETLLRLKVDITGIPESSYEMYDQLHHKIGEIMMAICEGNTGKERWDTSMNIPITDCERLGNYTRNKRRIVRVTFLFMKHKSCLLST